MRNLLVFLLFLPHLLSSQQLKLDWEKSLGNDARIHAMIESSNGYIVAVGETSAKTAGGTDGLLIIADHSTGQVIQELRFGGNKDDAFHAVAQTFDGKFLLAGSTASSGKGGDDAWLVSVNMNGRKTWETTFGTEGKDACLKMALLPDGSALLAGYQNNSKAGDIWLAKVNWQQIVWEKTLGMSEFDNLSGLALASDGGIVFCGNTGKKAEKKAEDK